jgi:hypothetical protein
MRNNSKTLEDIRKLDISQLNAETFMDLSGYKDWTYTISVARQLISDYEDGIDMCKETVLWAFDYATTTWEFDRGCYEILAHAWIN